MILPSSGVQDRGDRLVPRADRAVDLNPLHGIGRLLIGYSQLSQIGELPGDDLCIRPDPLEYARTPRAERAVPVVDEYRTLSTARMHILAPRYGPLFGVAGHVSPTIR